MKSLPVDEQLDRIAEAVKTRGGVVLSAEPGAGKTTRVPARLLKELEGEILVVQPRRLAARLAAARVAKERGEALGGTIGYQVRFDRKSSKDTRLLFLTEGILMRRLASDPSLRGVGALVFDELHERHLQSDLALALAKALRTRRRVEGSDLAIVAMSATLDAAPVAAFLDAPHLHVEGRTYPVQVHYDPGDDKPLDAHVASVVARVLREDPEGGDLLVFLPGAAEIRWAEQKCRAACKRAGVRLSVLHGDLPPKAQDEVVRAGGTRQVILSTNVAESSVTLPEVTTVIDSGLARQASFSPWTGLPTLAVQKISQASAIQRAGRAGRVRAGQAIRLYSEQDFRKRPEHETAEIARLDLCEMALLLRAQGHDPYAFPFFEAPSAAALGAADDLLARLGALEAGKVTELGKQLLQLPLHPRLGRLVKEGEARAVSSRACVVAALLAERPLRRGGRSDQSASADVLCDLDELERSEAERLRPNEMAARGLDSVAAGNILRVARQLKASVRAGEIEGSLEDEEDALRMCVLSAFPDRVGRRDGRRIVFAGGGSGELDEGSVVRHGLFAVATSVQDRSERGGRGKTLIRGACEVDAEMLLELFEERIESREEVRFDGKTAQVERVNALVYEGLTIDESVRRDGAGPAISACLAEAAGGALAQLFDMDAVDLLERRVAFAIKAGLAIAPVDHELRGRALRTLCEHRRSFADLKGASLDGAIEAELDPKAAAQLHRYAPTHIGLPRRQRVPVNYEVDRDPWVASRLQDFFGLRDGPKAGQAPLVLHLLAPNRRAVQVTTDLAGFWERHYPALRKQLMRRYPRHDWREDPLS